MDQPSVSDAAGVTSDPDTAKCYICLSLFEEQALGSLENCQHVFCLECILQWSQTASTCPVDRIGFAFIHQRRCPGGDIQKKIRVKTKRNEDEEEEEDGSSVVICEECGRSDRSHRLLECVRCDSGYHTDCLTPSLNSGPGGDWICPECAAVPQHAGADGSMLAEEEEEISDGELMDLLAEVDESPSTSSRLRPSTASRPGGSTERRHSRRIRSRAGSDAAPRRVQTALHVPKYLLRAAKPPATTEEEAAARHSPIELKERKRRKRTT